jgi:hypothetical protein
MYFICECDYARIYVDKHVQYVSMYIIRDY